MAPSTAPAPRAPFLSASARGDIVLADRFFCSSWVIAARRARGVEVVVRLHQRRVADFRCGHRWGRDDHVVIWNRSVAPPLDEPGRVRGDAAMAGDPRGPGAHPG
jgi:hypothetical protein